MIISHKTQSLDFSEDINKLICQIDVKLANEGQGKFIGERFGAKICINYEDFHLLSHYRKILLDKAQNDCCLSNILIDDIISRIKTLLNRN
jgi:hypothetical protein